MSKYVKLTLTPPIEEALAKALEQGLAHKKATYIFNKLVAGLREDGLLEKEE